MRIKLLLLFLLALSTPQFLPAKCTGKFELAPAYIHVDVIEAKRTVKDLDMAAIRADFSYVLESGWCAKPNLMYSKGKDGELSAFALGFGRYIPFCENKYAILPSIGISYTILNATIHLDIDGIDSIKLRNSFKAWAPYICMEFMWNITKCSRISTSVQYAWSRSHNRIKHLMRSKSDSEGFSYGLLLEYDLNQCWSINIGGAYNESFSKEKNGLRARGIKVGLVRWF